MSGDIDQARQESAPIFNVPGVVVLLIGIFAAVHLYRGWLGNIDNFHLLTQFGFTPARFFLAWGWIDPEEIGKGLTASGFEPAQFLPWLRAALSTGDSVWLTPLTYAFIHGDAGHVILNSLWFLAFGSVVARRLGAALFLVFFAATAIFSAILYGLLHSVLVIPMIGASGVVSGAMAAALLLPAQPFADAKPNSDLAGVPIMPLSVAIRDRRVVVTALIWIAINVAYAFGFTPGLPDSSVQIAWEAHIAGFFCGLFLISPLDKLRNRITRKEK